MTFPKKESFEVVASSSRGNAATTGHFVAGIKNFGFLSIDNDLLWRGDLLVY